MHTSVTLSDIGAGFNLIHSVLIRLKWKSSVHYQNRKPHPNGRFNPKAASCYTYVVETCEHEFGSASHHDLLLTIYPAPPSSTAPSVEFFRLKKVVPWHLASVATLTNPKPCYNANTTQNPLESRENVKIVNVNIINMRGQINCHMNENTTLHSGHFQSIWIYNNRLSLINISSKHFCSQRNHGHLPKPGILLTFSMLLRSLGPTLSSHEHRSNGKPCKHHTLY